MATVDAMARPTVLAKPMIRSTMPSMPPFLEITPTMPPTNNVNRITEALSGSAIASRMNVSAVCINASSMPSGENPASAQAPIQIPAKSAGMTCLSSSASPIAIRGGRMEIQP